MLDRKSPPFAENAKGGSPSSSGVVRSRIDRRAQPLRLRSGKAGTDVLQEPQEGRASLAPTKANQEGGVKPALHGMGLCG